MESARSTVPAPRWVRERTERRPGLVLAVSCLGYFFVLLDVTIVNVALQSIATDLSATRSELQWVVDGYALALASLMLSAGHVADGFGRRRIFIFGLAVFGVATTACALAPSPGALIAARVVQGVGAAALLPASLALVNASRRNPKERARAIGIWAGLGSFGLVVGPVLGGLLSDAFGWRAIFWFSVPLCAVAALAAVLWVEEPRGRSESSDLDPAGQLAGVIFLGARVGGLIEARTLGWISPLIIGALAVAAASFIGLIAAERRAKHPMLELRYFRNGAFSASNAGAGLMNLGVLGGLFVLSLLLQATQGHSPAEAGLMIVPLVLPLAVLPPFVGRLIERVGPRWPASLGLLGTGLGFALLAAAGSDASYGTMIGPMVLAGISLGFATPGLVTGATASVPAERAGMASAVNNTARQCGGAIGVALIGGIAGASAFLVSAVALIAGGIACWALVRSADM